MTREEAIEIVNKGKCPYPVSLKEKEKNEAFDMAISALAENKRDLISRGEVESVLHNNLHALIDTDQLYQLYKDIDHLPAYSFPDSAENKWIPCSERLPEIHQVVLLSLRSLDIEVGFRAETEPYFYCHGADGCYIEPQNVLAWQPLPEPYKGESEDKLNG